MSLNNSLSLITLSASWHKVIDVIIEGKIVKLDRRIRTFNEEEIPKEAEKTLYNLFNRTGTCKDIDTPWKIL